MPPYPQRFSMLTVAQLIISLFGLAFSLLSLTGLGLLLQLSPVETEFSQVDSSQFVPLYWLLGFMLLLSVPSIILSIRKLQGKPEIVDAVSGSMFKRSSILLVLWVPALYLGVEMSGKTGGRAFLPLVAILIIVIPLFWLVEFGRRNLPTGGRNRSWGVLTGSVFFSMPIIFAVEIIFIIAVLMGVGTWLVQQPEGMPLLEQLRGMSTFSPDDLQMVLPQLQEVVRAPGMSYLVIFGLCLVVPLIEELLKPLMVWFLAGRKLTPSEGFSTGLICGAGFAVIESLSAILSVDGTLYLSTAAGRVGTGLLHIFNSGMIGWALASAWQDGKYLKLTLTYLAAVGLHGLWNFFALLFGLSNTGLDLGLQSSSLLQAAPWMLGLMSVWMLTLLVVMNQKLSRETRLAHNLQQLPPPLDLPGVDSE